MQYDELLKAFGAKLGGVELRPDDNGCVVLDADGMLLTIMGQEEVRQVALTGEVGEPPPAANRSQPNGHWFVIKRATLA